MKLHERTALGLLAILLSGGAAEAMTGRTPSPYSYAYTPPAPAASMALSVQPAAAPASIAKPAAAPATVLAPAQNPAHEAAAPTLEDLIAKHAHDNGIPVGLAKAVIRIESRGNPRASNHGALGLMQIKTGTARNLGFGGSASGLFSPDTNLHYGMKVLAEAYRASSGDVCRTLAYYQSGHQVRHFSRAQRDYCARARSFMAHA